jgi:hypothetical protein
MTNIIIIKTIGGKPAIASGSNKMKYLIYRAQKFAHLQLV